jgi:hypothetical protein
VVRWARSEFVGWGGGGEGKTRLVRCIIAEPSLALDVESVQLLGESQLGLASVRDTFHPSNTHVSSRRTTTANTKSNS